jgi:Uma2 family endonuclease
MAPEPKRKLDYSFIQATPSDGKRYELVDGELLVNPAPSRIHQRISRRLQRQLEGYFHERRIGEVFNAPFDVILTRTTSSSPTSSWRSPITPRLAASKSRRCWSSRSCRRPRATSIAA